MKNSMITNFENKYLSKQQKVHPAFRPGDTVRVHYKLEETSKSSKDAKKYRIQVYEGVCITRIVPYRDLLVQKCLIGVLELYRLNIIHILSR